MGTRRAALLFVLVAALGDVGLCVADDGPATQRIRFHTLSVEQSLPQATARALAQDVDGFVWVATQDGLARYDGHEFEVFRHVPGDASGLGDNHITALAVAADGALWIGTQSGGLSRRDPLNGELRTFRAADGLWLRKDQITALLAHGETVLVGTPGGALHAWREGRFQTMTIGLGDDPGAIRQLRGGPSGALFVAARGGAWRCPASAHCEAMLAADSNRPLDAHDILDEGEQGIWGAAETGLYRFDAGLAQIEHLKHDSSNPQGLVSGAVRALLRDHRGRLWISTMNGLSMRDESGDRIRSWRHQPGLVRIACSQPGAGFDGGSRRSSVGRHLDQRSLPARSTHRSLCLAGTQSGRSAGDTWSGGSRRVGGERRHAVVGHTWRRRTGACRSCKGRTCTLSHQPEDPSSLSHGFVQFITRDRRGVLWVATQGGGLNRMRNDGSGFDHFRHQPDDAHSIPSDFLLHLHADRDNTLWIATSDRGLAWLCDGCETFGAIGDQPEQPDAPGGNTVNSSFEDSNGRLWVALRPGGLSLLDRQRMRFSRIVAEPGEEQRLSSNTISVVFEDSRGQLWIGTQGGGLYQLQEYAGQQSRFRRCSRNEGLGADAIGGIIEDDRGYLWVSTTAGLSRLDPADGTIENFSAQEGAQSTGYFIGSYGRFPDGRMAFGGLRGVTLFDPDQIPMRPPAKQVVVTRLTSLGARAEHPDPLLFADLARASGHIELGHPANDLLVEFSELAFAAPDSVSYRFRLDGLDDDWIETRAQRRFAAYTNLRPGDYRFRVSAIVAGRAGPEAVLDVAIGSSPWQHPLAYLGYALLVAGALAVFALQLFGRWRERERARLALSESEERLKLALWGTGDELWDIDLARDELRRENPLPHIAASSDSRITKASSLRKVLHPDDVAPFDQAFKRHLSGQSDSLEITYRVRDVNDRWCWLRCRGRVVERDASGKPLRIAGPIGDINALRRSELQLQALNQALEQRVSERTADLTYANQRLQRTVADLRLAQRHLVESEKMAALGWWPASPMRSTRPSASGSRRPRTCRGKCDDSARTSRQARSIPRTSRPFAACPTTPST